MSRLLAALLAALALAGPLPVSATSPQAEPKGTTATEWRERSPERSGLAVRSTRAGRAVLAYTSRMHNAGQEFNAVGPHWKAHVPPGASLSLQLRTRPERGAWTPWRSVETHGGHGDQVLDRGRTYGPLVVGDLARHAQYRLTTSPSKQGVWPRVSDVTLTFIDSTRGPSAEQAAATASSAGPASRVAKPAIISRKGWGADERYRFDKQGKEIWGREYLQITKAVLHDTVTRNNDPNPAATVRSIYYYHAVTRGWGDIGYNYLIDEQGRIYEGRYGGDNVVAGHALCYNFGTVGIAALGWHGGATGGTPAGVRPKDDMVRAFERLIAWQFDRHGINPKGRGVFMKRNVDPKGNAPNIMGHIDASRMPTAEQRCENSHVDPGKYLYERFPEIRRNTAKLLGYNPTPRPRITDVTFAPTKLNAGGRLRVDVAIRNDGTGLLETQAPNPATVYGERETWVRRGFAKVPGKYRILVDRADNPTSETAPYRWGLGSPLLPGESRVVTGYVSVPRVGSAAWWAGLNREGVASVIARTGEARVSVVGSGAEDETGGAILDAQADPPTISPNGDGRGESTTIRYRLATAQRVKVELFSADGRWVKTLRPWTSVGTDPQGTLLTARVYDPVRRLARPLPAGVYHAVVVTRDARGGVRQARVPVRTDFAPPSVGAVTRDPAWISPNGDGVQDAATVSASFSEPVRWTIRVRDASGRLVRTLRGTGRTLAAVWPGATASGRALLDGEYSYELSYADLAGNRGAPRTGGITVDTARPSLRSLAASGDGPYSLSYKLGERAYVALSITNASGEEVLERPKRLRDARTLKASWDGTLPDGSAAPPGTYTWNVYATDRAGNSAEAYPATVGFEVR